MKSEITVRAATVDEAVAKGIYPASAYDDSKVDSSVPAVPMSQLPYADAETLVKNYNKK